MAELFDRRTFFALSGIGALTVLAGCSADGSTPPPSASGGSPFGDVAISHATPKRGGVVKVGSWSDQPGLNPVYNAMDMNGIEMVAPTLYDTLAVATQDAKVAPELAETIVHNADCTVWTVTLRSGVRYHDGTPFTAATAAAVWNAVRKSPTTMASYMNLTDVKATDEHTVVFTADAPWPAFDAYLTTVWMVHPDMLSPDYKGNPVGTGPFTFNQWVPGSKLLVDKNHDYWRKGIPYLDGVEFTIIPDSQQRENALKSGSVDMISVGSPLNDMPALKANPDLRYRDDRDSWPFVPSMAYWILNCAAEPTDDIRVREALALATDQRQYSTLAFHGLGSMAKGDEFVAATGPFRPGSDWYAKTAYPAAPDRAKAKKLIAEYAAEKGKPKINIMVIPDRSTLAAAQLAQSQWGAIGVEVTLEQVEAAKMIGDTLKGQFQGTFWTGGLAVDPDQNYSIWNPAYAAPIGQFSAKPDRLADPKLGPLLDKGRRALDRKDRAAAYQQFAEQMTADFPYIYMGFVVGGFVSTKKFDNWAGTTTEEGAPVWWHARPFTQSWLT